MDENDTAAASSITAIATANPMVTNPSSDQVRPFLLTTNPTIANPSRTKQTAVLSARPVLFQVGALKITAAPIPMSASRPIIMIATPSPEMNA